MILLRYGYLNDMLQERQLPLAVPIAVGVGLAVTLAAVIAMVPVRQPVPDNVTVAVKADKPTVDPDVKRVRTIAISRLPAQVVMAPAVLPDPVPQAPPELAQHIMPVAPPSRPDICRKHGGYRETRGRSWHCVYRH